MHACRLKAGFPTVFEIVSAKSEWCQAYLCVSFKKSDWYIQVDLKFQQDSQIFNVCKECNLSNNLHRSYLIYTYMHTCRLKQRFTQDL